MDVLAMPALLGPGARVAVVAPAGPVPFDRLDRGLDWLRAAGFEPVESESLRSRGTKGMAFLAAADDARRSDLVAAMTDPTIDAVIAGRGGDGTPRLLDGLPWDLLAAMQPKVVAGLSDITALHQALAARAGWATLWSPMPATSVLAGYDPDDWSRQTLLEALSATPTTDELVLSGRMLHGDQPVTGPLVGGTISLLAAMAGTMGFHPAKGAVAILEDVGEYPYRLERFLTQLRRSGFFDEVAGIAVGDLTDCGTPDEAEAVIQDAVSDLAVPVVDSLDFGHGPRQASLWLGRPAILDPITATLSQARPA